MFFFIIRHTRAQRGSHDADVQIRGALVPRHAAPVHVHREVQQPARTSALHRHQPARALAQLHLSRTTCQEFAFYDLYVPAFIR